jgi:hypothetical protein
MKNNATHYATCFANFLLIGNFGYSREKVKSFIWNGAIRGEVYDSYSGLGAISADLCILGDVRDLGIQSWKYVTDSEDFDRFIMLLSAAGLGYLPQGLQTIVTLLQRIRPNTSRTFPESQRTGCSEDSLKQSSPLGFYMSPSDVKPPASPPDIVIALRRGVPDKKNEKK